MRSQAHRVVEKLKISNSRAFGFYFLFLAALLAFVIFAERLSIYAANRVSLTDSLTGAELLSVEIDGGTGNPLSSDWIFGASHFSDPDNPPVYRLGETYQGNHVTASNESEYMVKLTARVIADSDEASESGTDGDPIPQDEIRYDWSDPQSAAAGWDEAADVLNPDWSFSNDYEHGGGYRTSRSVLERTTTKVTRIFDSSVAEISKSPSQQGLIHGMTLDLGEIQPGEEAVYGFEMTLDGRNYWNASQEARAVFYLEFDAIYVLPGPTGTPTPSPSPKPSPAPPSRPEEPIVSTSNPGLPLETISPTPSPTEWPLIELHQSEPPGDPADIPTEAPVETASPTDNPKDDPEGSLLVPANAEKPKTGDSRMRVSLVLINIALIAAFILLRDKKRKGNGS
jgi:hypothetical protein